MAPHIMAVLYGALPRADSMPVFVPVDTAAAPVDSMPVADTGAPVASMPLPAADTGAPVASMPVADTAPVASMPLTDTAPVASMPVTDTAPAASMPVTHSTAPVDSMPTQFLGGDTASRARLLERSMRVAELQASARVETGRKDGSSCGHGRDKKNLGLLGVFMR